ncbi:MAG: hypothetical protein ABWY06_07935 [Pseudomonas sp.]|uniref:hypothetical protein n=1 Tax=Pseudomonas sp. TaxID=306 RepID=UPI003394661F
MKKSLLFGLALALPFTAWGDSLGPLDTTADTSAKSAAAPSSAVLAPSATSIVLSPLSSQKHQALSSERHEPGTPQRVGLRRDIQPLSSRVLTTAALQWSPTPDGGQVAAISITSPQAISLRAGIYVDALPASAILRVYSQQSKVPIEASGSEVLQAIESNLRAGDTSDEAHYFWSAPVTGDEITLEIELPAGIASQSVAIRIPALSHLYRDPTASGTQKRDEDNIGDSGTCNVNYQCAAAQDNTLEQQSRATAKMVFVEQGDSYLCSGTLLNNTNQDKTPYFLSANHCISNQTVASTLVTYWMFRARSCFSTAVDNDSSMLTGGAQLLYTNVAKDTSFFGLNKAAPAGSAFAGWNTNVALYNLNQRIVGVHHPAGDLQKVSKGSVVEFVKCNGTTCVPSGQSSASAVEVQWNTGVTEGGSSGSGLFNGAELIAHLYGGDSSCSFKQGRDQYSLFAPAYDEALSKWLSPAPIVEFYNADLKHYFITGDPNEQRFVDSGQVGRWVRTGLTFKAGGSTAVCRFYGNSAIDPKTGTMYGPNSHFYTGDAAGCKQLVDLYNPKERSWKFESLDFYTRLPSKDGACAAGTQAVYRLYNNGFAKGEDSNHRFVTDASVIPKMVEEGWLDEGVNMCAPL